MPRRALVITFIALFSLGLLSVCPAFSETAKTTAKLTVDAASSKQKENKSRVNWIAVSSMATLAAVLVALFSPITWEIYRRRQAARILRQQILLQLMLLRPIVARRFVDTGLGPATYAGLDAHE